jgi:hypothetical protein
MYQRYNKCSLAAQPNAFNPSSSVNQLHVFFAWQKSKSSPRKVTVYLNLRRKFLNVILPSGIDRPNSNNPFPFKFGRFQRNKWYLKMASDLLSIIYNLHSHRSITATHAVHGRHPTQQDGHASSDLGVHAVETLAGTAAHRYISPDHSTAVVPLLVTSACQAQLVLLLLWLLLPSSFPVGMPRMPVLRWRERRSLRRHLCRRLRRVRDHCLRL